MPGALRWRRPPACDEPAPCARSPDLLGGQRPAVGVDYEEAEVGVVEGGQAAQLRRGGGRGGEGEQGAGEGARRGWMAGHGRRLGGLRGSV
jgi:hypothetical protein